VEGDVEEGKGKEERGKEREKEGEEERTTDWRGCGVLPTSQRREEARAGPRHEGRTMPFTHAEAR